MMLHPETFRILAQLHQEDLLAERRRSSPLRRNASARRISST
jgi:hypothetical protein